MELGETLRAEIDIDDVLRSVELRKALKLERQRKIQEGERKRVKEVLKVKSLSAEEIEHINSARVSSNAKKQMQSLYAHNFNGRNLMKMALLKRNPYVKQKPYHLYAAFERLIQDRRFTRKDLISDLVADDRMQLKTAYAKQAVAAQTLLAMGVVKETEDGVYTLSCLR
jgi:hypothetical protein